MTIEKDEIEIILECGHLKGLLSKEAIEYITHEINDYLTKKQTRDFEIANKYKRPNFK